MSLTFASNLTKMIDAGLGGDVIAPDTSVAIGYRMQYNMVSGPVASWNDPEGGLPINIAAEFGPIQSGSGDPSPENVRPISGRTAVTVWRSGKNLCPGAVKDDTAYGLTTVNNADGTFTVSGTYDRNAATPYYDASKDFVLPAGSYVLSGTPTNPLGIYLRIRRLDSSSYLPNIFTLSEPTNMRVVMYVPRDAYGLSLPEGGVTFSPMVRLSADDASFAAYDADSVIVQLGQTVYGGRLNLTTGALTVTMAMVDMGSLNWNFHTSSGNMYADNALSNRLVNGRTGCSMFKYVKKTGDSEMGGVAELTENNAYAFQYNLPHRVIARDTSYTDAAEFKTAVTGQQLVYELATPQTIQLSPQTINSLLGHNNVWSDAGDVTVTWKEKLYTEGY